MDKKNITLWASYDFANSIVIVVFFVYFSQWLVVDKGVSDFNYNLIFAVSSLLLLLTAPIAGSIADRRGTNRSWLNWLTILTFAFFLLTALSATIFPRQVYTAAMFFLLANYFYQFSFGFYNALLHEITSRKNEGKISGIGQAGNWLGQIAGLAIALPFAAGTIYLFGEAGRAQTLLPAVLVFFVVSLPMLLLFKKSSPRENPPVKISLRQEYGTQWKQFKALVRSPGMGTFLLAYFFFNDAIIVIANNLPIYLQNIFGVSDQTKVVFLIGILLTSALGAWLAGHIADRVGLKRAFTVILISWVIILPILAITSSFYVFGWLSVAMGFLFGAIWTVTRAIMLKLCPKNKLNYGFSFYTMVERVSTIVAPLSWGLITTLLIDRGPVRYRVAMASLAIFVALGFFIARKLEIVEAD